MNKSCYDYALGHLSRYPKTVADLRRFLMRKGYEKAVIEDAIERLSEKGFLDDKTYAHLFISSEVCRNGKPIYVIEQKLLLKGVDRAIIAEEKEQQAEEIEEGMCDKITLLAERLHQRGYEPMKILQNISGRGYPYELVKRIVSFN